VSVGGNLDCLNRLQIRARSGRDYPQPQTIGPDRLANALAAKRRFGAPVVVIDFGTAVTFDVVDRKGNYIGGIIARAGGVTDYLHEKRRSCPDTIRDVNAAVGKHRRSGC